MHQFQILVFYSLVRFTIFQYNVIYFIELIILLFKFFEFFALNSSSLFYSTTYSFFDNSEGNYLLKITFSKEGKKIRILILFLYESRIERKCIFAFYTDMCPIGLWKLFLRNVETLFRLWIYKYTLVCYRVCAYCSRYELFARRCNFATSIVKEFLRITLLNF